MDFDVLNGEAFDVFTDGLSLNGFVPPYPRLTRAKYSKPYAVPWFDVTVAL